MVTQKEKEILRELAKKYSLISGSDEQKQKIKRQRDNNDLIPGRPPVLIDELPWHEMNLDNQLSLICEDNFAKKMEWFFRRKLFQHKYFPCDMIMENYYPIQKIINSTGIGLKVEEETIASDSKNNIISHQYHDQLKDEESLEKIKIPVITDDKAEDEKNLEMASDILLDILPVRLCGTSLYFAPWDQICRYRNVEAILYDMADSPEHNHKIIKKFAEIGEYTLNRYEQLGLLECETPTIHCTPAFSSALPAGDYNGGAYRLKDCWFRSMAQMFSTISPDMHEEYDLQYTRPLFEKCGLGYYGCCEPLDNKLELITKIPNIRKIGVSPWSSEEISSEFLGGGYVYARKPNPADVAIKTDPDYIKSSIRKTVELCLKNGCVYEFVLKDISTVSYKPENIFIWEKAVCEVLDEYY